MQYSKKRLVNKAIPDNDPNGLLDVVRVVRDLTVKDVCVHVNISHPYTGDVSVELTAPNGKKKVLHSPSRVPGKDLKKKFQGDLLDLFNGQKSKGEWILKVSDNGAKDSGTLEDWTLDLTLANSKRSEVFVDDKETLSSTQVCHQGGKISSLSCSMHVEHGHIGDLHCELFCPSGKSVVLHNKTGGASQNLNKTYGDDILKGLHGESAKGKWSLKIKDTLKGDAGRLVSWKLNIKTQSKSAAASSDQKDDLTKIEGIGPKIKELLYNAGIYSFRSLSQTEVSKIKTILDKEGPRYQMHDPGSWPRQSLLAADGKWKELEKLQDELDGGK